MIKIVFIIIFILIGLLCFTLCAACGKMERELEKREWEGSNIPGPTTIPKAPKRRDEELPKSKRRTHD